jgi:indole-3-glycerol phosphate synthase
VTVATYLDRILREHREAASADTRPLEGLLAAAQQCPPTRGFRAALVASPGLAVVAEVKRRSPSKGVLSAAIDPAALARQYEAGGAACLSVLTDSANFGGSPADLQAARDAVGLPVLRKDFTVHERDVCDARLMGADAVLLIVAALDDDELGRFAGLATLLGLDVLVETHDEAEVERALAAGADLVGVNQRDLVTFEVDHERACRVAAAIPERVVSVAESGVRDAADAKSLAAAGFDAILVGETLVRSDDPAAAVRSLRGE